MKIDTEERNRKISQRYGEGETYQAIGNDYGITREAVRQIIRKVSGPDADTSRAERGLTREKQQTELARLLRDEASESMEIIANNGQTKLSLSHYLSILRPELSSDVIDEAIRLSKHRFSRNNETKLFSENAIRAGYYYVFGRSLDFSCTLNEVFTFVSYEDAVEISSTLEELNVDAITIAEVIRKIATAMKHVSGTETTALARKQYDDERLKALGELGVAVGQGSSPWPPTGQTIAKRLGNGYWKDAVSSMGFQSNAKGRPRGEILYSNEDYVNSVSDFLRHAESTDTAETYEAFSRWIAQEEKQKIYRPSAPAVRLHFRTWQAAKRLVLAGEVREIARRDITGMRSFAGAARERAAEQIADFLSILRASPLADRTAQIDDMSYVVNQQFEINRREWLQNLIIHDDLAVVRALASPELKGKERKALQEYGKPSAALTHMYLDNLLKNGPLNCGPWLSETANEAMERVPTTVSLKFRVLRELRNLAAHVSDESHSRLREALIELATVDPRYEFKTTPTVRIIGKKLLSSDALLLEDLLDCVDVLWGAMSEVEEITRHDLASRLSQ